MPNKTADIESAITDHLAYSPVTLDQLMSDLGWVGDPRWIGVALVHLRQREEIRYAACDANHSHSGLCSVELNR